MRAFNTQYGPIEITARVKYFGISTYTPLFRVGFAYLVAGTGGSWDFSNDWAWCDFSESASANFRVLVSDDGSSYWNAGFK
jgi:hypothetical protein